MPELPEVEGLAAFLREHAVGRFVAELVVASPNALKTVDPAPAAFAGSQVTAVSRHGKFVDIDCSGLHLVIHLAKAGWLRWREEIPAGAMRPGRGPVAARLRLDDGSGFELTEAGTRKGLAIHLVRDPREVPGVARRGIDPLSEAFTLEAFTALLRSHNAQVKGVLREQSLIAGVGNAYSDEVLHVARLSPFAIAARLDDDAIARLHDAITGTLRDAVARSVGLAASDLKDAKRVGMRVHGRTGQPCPECGDTVREVSFADSSLQYCPTCQTGGRPLADRRLSRLLK